MSAGSLNHSQGEAIRYPVNKDEICVSLKVKRCSFDKGSNPTTKHEDNGLC